MADAGVQAPIHKNRKTTLPRISNFISATRCQETNLVGRLYPKIAPVTLSYWALPGGEGAWQDWTFQDIIAQTFVPVEVGGSYGPTWTTHWFKVDFSIPEDWIQDEVRFCWKSGTEATVWSSDGKVLQGLSDSTREDCILTHSFSGDTSAQVIYIEMAASKMFGGSPGDDIDPPDPNLYFTLTKAELVVMDTTVYQLTRDLEVLYQIADNLLDADPRSYMAMHSANQIVNLILEGNDSGALAIADEYFAKGNGQRSHTLAAIGNCHIDTAWLWPFSETKRKVARSFSSQLALMNDYPEFIFVGSQAQQWKWLQEYYPELFERIKLKIAEGKFLPVGSTWVEMDGNMPSGESFIRQFFYGQKFFTNQCGFTCKEFWLPDTFGYNGHIPGLMRHCKLTRFLTQKMSWNMVNKFPHHNFTWQGIDGESVLAHFPPGDSYSMTCSVEEANRTVTNLQDKGRVSTSAYLFGHGDGGGGPTQDMLERARRLADADGVPKMVMTTPDQLFTQLETEQHNMMTWSGELFLELHNGTYTSQAAMKQLCRYAEFRLRDAEFMLSSAVASQGAAAETLLTESLATLETAWKKVLLNQFHDVLPGSGIAMIYSQASTYYNEAIAAADQVLKNAVDSLFGTSTEASVVAMNTLQWPRREVVELTTNPLKKKKQKDSKGKVSQQVSEYALVDVTAFGYGEIVDNEPGTSVTVEEINGNFVMANGMISATISPYGQVLSLTVAGNARDLFTSGEGSGNQITLYDDEPLYWDAWDVMDYHLETAKVLNTSSSASVTNATIIESGPLVGRLSWSLAISEVSSMTQEIELMADSPYLTFNTTVNWNESHKMLKTNFATNVFAQNAAYEIQFGFIERPTHMNTSWDTARYEVCGHKWADISEPDIGLSILNDSKFGWEGRGSTLTLSLLKAPKAPDDTCDMRTHTFKYAVMPHQGSLQEAEVMRRGYEFNNPLRLVEVPTSAVATNPSWSLFSTDGSGIVLHTIKPTDDGSGDLILRVFESNGCRSSATLSLKFICTAVRATNGMEDTDGEEVPFTTDAAVGITSIELALTPFAIYALRLSL